MRTLTTLTLLLSLAGLQACAQPQPPAAAPSAPQAAASAPAELQALRAELLAAIGSPRCTADAQCRSLGLGQRPCGGPQSYVAVSTLNTDAGAIERLAQRYRERVSAEQQASGRVSHCRALPDPGARCGAAGLCELGGGASLP